MPVTTIAMLIVVTTFGFGNVIDNLVEIGLAAIPSWLIVGVLYFLPLALILAEFASDTRKAGGIYSYMDRGLGPSWAFVGTWSYFVANLVYLQSSFSRLPIRASLSLTGADVFAESAVLLPVLGVLLCVAITFVASRGVRRFSRLADWFGWGTLLLVFVLICVPIAALLLGYRDAATDMSLAASVPAFDLDYFSTFAWLLFAVAGAEVAAPYVHETRNPARDFPRAIIASTLLIAAVYVLASVAVVIVMPLESLTLATGLYDIWLGLADLVGLPAEPFARAAMSFLVLGMVVAVVVWTESPIRAMFTEVPAGTFPERLIRRDQEGTHGDALWIQAGVVAVLILIPLVSILTGNNRSEVFLSLLNDLASLSLVVPYVFIALAYIQARRDGMDAPFKMVRSTPLAMAIAWLVVAVSVAGYFGAGLYALQSDPVDWIYVAIVYGGPVAMIGLGMLLRSASKKAHLLRQHARAADVEPS